MAKKTKTRQITLINEKGTFSSLFKRFSGDSYDFEGLSALRNLLSNEKARMLHIIKTKSPKSIYDLAKILGRDFKSVSDDVKLLQRFGFLDLVEEKTGKRARLKPVISVDTLNIEVRI